jgi:hypothetical protein
MAEKNTATADDARDKILAVVNEVDGILDGIEAASEHAGQIRGVMRQAKRLSEALDDLESELGVTCGDRVLLESVGHLEGYLPTANEHLDELVHQLTTTKDAGAIFTDLIPVEEIDKVLARHREVMAAAKTSSKPGKTRGIGAEITVDCACGAFTRSSTNGDWTSIRYQAKKHAEECKVANPHDEFINNLDEVRHSIVDRRENIESGGLTFEVAGGAPAAP